MTQKRIFGFLHYSLALIVGYLACFFYISFFLNHWNQNTDYPSTSILNNVHFQEALKAARNPYTPRFCSDKLRSRCGLKTFVVSSPNHNNLRETECGPAMIQCYPNPINTSSRQGYKRNTEYAAERMLTCSSPATLFKDITARCCTSSSATNLVVDRAPSVIEQI